MENGGVDVEALAAHRRQSANGWPVPLPDLRQGSLADHEDSGEGKRKDDDFLWSMRHFLRFGKVFGIIPFDGVVSCNRKKLKQSFPSMGTLYSAVIFLFLVAFSLVSFAGLMYKGGENATMWTVNAGSFIFYFMGTFVYAYMLSHGNTFISILSYQWPSFLKTLHFTKTDVNLGRDINLIAGSLFTSAILENLLLQVVLSDGAAGANNSSTSAPLPPQKSALLTYFEKETHLSAFVSYHPAWSVVIFISNKFALYSWNFADILIILCSRAIYHKFKTLGRVAHQKLLEGGGGLGGGVGIGVDPNSNGTPSISWHKFLEEYKQLINMLQSFASFLSPLVLASYGTNCFFICLQLHLGLTAEKQASSSSIVKRVYASWSFIHLIVRTFLVSLYAAKVNDYADKVLEVLYKVPEDCDNNEMQKFRFRMSTTKQGLDGLGCFVITRSLILAVIHVIFTMEIVLIQNPGEHLNNKNAQTAAQRALRCLQRSDEIHQGEEDIYGGQVAD